MTRTRDQMRYDVAAEHARPHGHRIRFDPGTRNTLAICTCGWRDITASRAAAYQLATQHLQNAAGQPDTWLTCYGPRR